MSARTELLRCLHAARWHLPCNDCRRAQAVLFAHELLDRVREGVPVPADYDRPVC